MECKHDMGGGVACGLPFRDGYCDRRHEDPAARAEDVARLERGDRDEPTKCPVCDKPLAVGDHKACIAPFVRDAVDGMPRPS